MTDKVFRNPETCPCGALIPWHLFEVGDEHYSHICLCHREFAWVSPTEARNVTPGYTEVPGYTSCPCCGYDTISSDMSKPELCETCAEAGCNPEGTDPCCEGCEE